MTRWAEQLIDHSRGNARRRELDHDLDTEFVRELFARQAGRCHWFGIEMIPSPDRRDPQHPSLDRIDPSKGYTRDNVVLACVAANMGRSEASSERFTAFVETLRSALSSAAAE